MAACCHARPPRSWPSAPGRNHLRYREGYALGQAFYTDPGLYPAELTGIWQQGWLFAAVSAELPDAGSYVVFNVGAASAIVVRPDDGTVAAHHNVCRHRGSLIATRPGGQARNFTCPYHQWMDGLDGTLRRCRAMPPDFDRSQYGLLPVHATELAGTRRRGPAGTMNWPHCCRSGSSRPSRTGRSAPASSSGPPRRPTGPARCHQPRDTT